MTRQGVLKVGVQCGCRQPWRPGRVRAGLLHACKAVKERRGGGRRLSTRGMRAAEDGRGWVAGGDTIGRDARGLVTKWLRMLGCRNVSSTHVGGGDIHTYRGVARG